MDTQDPSDTYDQEVADLKNTLLTQRFVRLITEDDRLYISRKASGKWQLSWFHCISTPVYIEFDNMHDAVKTFVETCHENKIGIEYG
jgi:hypothetical protein